MPVLQGRRQEDDRTLCWYLMGNRAIRQGKWKLVWGHTGRKWELYDMDADRTETHDLVDQYPNRVTRMKATWFDWAEQCGIVIENYAFPL